MVKRQSAPQPRKQLECPTCHTLKRADKLAAHRATCKGPRGTTPSRFQRLCSRCGKNVYQQNWQSHACRPLPPKPTGPSTLFQKVQWRALADRKDVNVPLSILHLGEVLRRALHDRAQSLFVADLRQFIARRKGHVFDPCKHRQFDDTLEEMEAMGYIVLAKGRHVVRRQPSDSSDSEEEALEECFVRVVEEEAEIVGVDCIDLQCPICAPLWSAYRADRTLPVPPPHMSHHYVRSPVVERRYEGCKYCPHHETLRLGPRFHAIADHPGVRTYDMEHSGFFPPNFDHRYFQKNGN